ncbi:hypothetical protein FRC11_002837 [Ceratobasidium sp. 423]|nr:hypothetical protein FRC11_002837 [Ceratobasidium sp. 423]
MAKYRSKYSLITFPSVSILVPYGYFYDVDHNLYFQNATYTPPELPAHISVKLEPVSGAPSDEEIMRAQEALRSCQQFSHVPSMFDTHVNMELSQHLFDLQMARYMRLAGENPSNPLPQPTERTEIPVRAVERSLNTAEQLSDATNNAGTGAITAPPPVSGPDVRELIDRSNQLAERFNVLLERSNELVERCNQPTHQPDSQASDERFNQVLERLTQLEQSHRQTEQSDRLTERFNQLFERFNQLIEQASLPTQRSNELAERSNQLAARASQLAEQLNQLSDERFNQLLQRLTRVEQSHRQTEQSDRLTGRFNQLFERFNQLVGQACLPAQRANELAEQSNQLAARANQLAELLIQSSERSNTLSEQGNRSWRRLEVVMGNVNKVLMRIQHAIVRNHRGNTISALDCLVNEKGETHATSGTLPLQDIEKGITPSNPHSRNTTPQGLRPAVPHCNIPGVSVGLYFERSGRAIVLLEALLPSSWKYVRDVISEDTLVKCSDNEKELGRIGNVEREKKVRTVRDTSTQ